MSYQQPPPPGYYQPGGPTPGFPQRPVKYRPRPLWWVVGGALLIIGCVLAVVMLVHTVTSVAHTDRVIPADGDKHSVTVPSGSDRMLFTSGGTAAACTVRDGSGEIAQKDITGSVTVTTDGREWQAFSRIPDTGDGKLEVRCDPPPGSTVTGSVRVGPSLNFGSFGVGLLLVFVGGFLAFAGLVVLVVTLILTVTRQPRPKT